MCVFLGVPACAEAAQSDALWDAQRSHVRHSFCVPLPLCPSALQYVVDNDLFLLDYLDTHIMELELNRWGTQAAHPPLVRGTPEAEAPLQEVPLQGMPLRGAPLQEVPTRRWASASAGHAAAGDAKPCPCLPAMHSLLHADLCMEPTHAVAAVHTRLLTASHIARVA